MTWVQRLWKTRAQDISILVAPIALGVPPAGPRSKGAMVYKIVTSSHLMVHCAETTTHARASHGRYLAASTDFRPNLAFNGWFWIVTKCTIMQPRGAIGGAHPSPWRKG